MIKKLKDQNANGEDSRLIGIRLKEIETEHLTQTNINKEISWSPKIGDFIKIKSLNSTCLLYTSPSPRDPNRSRMPSSA